MFQFRSRQARVPAQRTAAYGMNKEQLKKTLNSEVQLRPRAIGAGTVGHDDDWKIDVVDEIVRIVNTRTGHHAVLGFDSIISFTSNPARDDATVRRGFLQLSVQVETREDGSAAIEPIPFGRGGGNLPQLNPLIVRDGSRERLFSWRGHGDDALHELQEERPAQLMDFYLVLCAALRTGTGREPEFCSLDRLTGEVVFEVSDDLRARWPLLGGHGGKVGTSLLVLTQKSARQTDEGIGQAVVQSDSVDRSRLELRKQVAEARVEAKEVAQKIAQARASRIAIFAATGMARSGAMESWKSQCESATAEARRLLGELPSEDLDFSEVVAKDLETQLVLVHRVRTRASQLRATYERELSLDDKRREEIRAHHEQRFRPPEK